MLECDKASCFPTAVGTILHVLVGESWNQLDTPGVGLVHEHLREVLLVYGSLLPVVQIHRVVTG